jgi:hypothetical protein
MRVADRASGKAAVTQRRMPRLKIKTGNLLHELRADVGHDLVFGQLLKRSAVRAELSLHARPRHGLFSLGKVQMSKLVSKIKLDTLCTRNS